MPKDLKPAAGLLACACLTILGCGGGPDDPDPEGNLFLSNRILNIAHRGGGRLAPEATLEAFESALKAGADVLELDLHATLDGVLVCMHDADVDRTTDGDGFIKNMTFDALRALDAGYSFTQDGGQTFPARGMGVFVPAFDEILEAHPNAYYIVEIKQVEPPIVDSVLEMIARLQVGEQIILASVTDSLLQEIREKVPGQMTSYGTAEMINFATLTDEEEQDYQPPCQFMQPPYGAIDETMVSRAERFGIKAHPWTVNDETEMRRLISLGIAGIITDDPALLGSVLEDMDLR